MVLFFRKEKKIDYLGEGSFESDEKMLAVIESLPDGILIFTEAKNLSFINFQAQTLLNVSAKDVLGKNILEMGAFGLCQPLVSFLGGGIKSASGEEISFKSDFILEVSSIPLNIDGQKTRSVVVLKDISRKKMLEKMKSEFITVAAHQLRTPTSAVKWASKGILDGDAGAITPILKDFVEKIYITNEKVINLVSNLLDVIEIEEGKYLSKPVLTDISEIAVSCANDYKEMARKKGVSVFFKKTSSELPKVMVDREKMKIAFSDLIDNALKYTKAGGKIEIILGKGTNGNLEAEVKDNGIGIPEKDQEKVFSKFFRGDEAIKIDTEGKGLGLFITKNIIEAHGGKVWFESKEGKGSSFYFTLPVKERFGEYLTKEFY